MLRFETGSDQDIDAVVALFDANIEWLLARGSADQWGSDPFSTNPAKVDFVRKILAGGLVTLAKIDEEVVGASVVSNSPMPYVPAVGEPERYLTLLIASPAHRGEGIGHHLIERAREFTISEGVHLMRVDCWSGGVRRLVAYYESEGFTSTQEIEVRPGTSVQVFEWRSSSGRPEAV